MIEVAGVSEQTFEQMFMTGACSPPMTRSSTPGPRDQRLEGRPMAPEGRIAAAAWGLPDCSIEARIARLSMVE